MDWQQMVSLMIVAGAAGLLLWGKFRRRRFSFQCETHCGCAATQQSSPQSSMVYRARKGQRPEVVLKWQ